MILITGNNSPTFLSEKKVFFCNSKSKRSQNHLWLRPSSCLLQQATFQATTQSTESLWVLSCCGFSNICVLKGEAVTPEALSDQKLSAAVGGQHLHKKSFFYALRLRWGQGDRGEVWMELHSFIFILKHRRFHHRFTLLINTWLLIQVRKNRATKWS